jgi:NAD(P)H-flavin reductase
MCECCTEVKKDIYLPLLATVQETRMMNDTEMYLRLTMDHGAFDYLPGQFVEISIAGIGEAPLTIASSPTFKEGFEIVVRRIGNVTKARHGLKPGDKCGVRGPLGQGIYPVDASKGKDIVFICGGIGLVPQRSFIKWVLDHRDDYGRVVILQGARDMSQRLFQDELVTWARQKDCVVMETLDKKDEGWHGHVGVVTTLIRDIDVDLKGACVSVCGPPIMYKFVLMALEDYQVPHENIYLNLERRMKCGVGKCGHCQINDIYCCMDGPVFKYSDLASIPEAI